MSAAAERGAMIPVTRAMRAFFAPVDRANEIPTIFDPAASGEFPLDAPPAPWVDVGWIENFARWYESPNGVVRSGAKGFGSAQFRGPVTARVEFDFCQWGKLQMALAGGSEHMNVLAATADGGMVGPSGGTPEGAVAVLAGSTASELVLGTGVASTFAVGGLVAIDVDYQQQVGYVGSGIAAAYVKRSPGSAARPQLHPAGNFQCGTSGGSHREFHHFVTTFAWGNSVGWSFRAEGSRIRGSRGRLVLPGVVGIICGGTRVWRAGVLLLSTSERDDGGGESETRRVQRHCEAIVRDISPSFVPGAAFH
ncbi:MAG: hypothetical protein ACJ72H_31540 [Candidatus Sulfotelmatobacter sp.]